MLGIIATQELHLVQSVQMDIRAVAVKVLWNVWLEPMQVAEAIAAQPARQGSTAL